MSKKTSAKKSAVKQASDKLVAIAKTSVVKAVVPVVAKKSVAKPVAKAAAVKNSVKAVAPVAVKKAATKTVAVAVKAPVAKTVPEVVSKPAAKSAVAVKKPAAKAAVKVAVQDKTAKAAPAKKADSGATKKNIKRISKTGLIDMVCVDTGMKPAEVEKCYNAVVKAIQGSLKSGKSVVMVGFGTFSVRKKPARTINHPVTQKPMKVAARNMPHFNAGKTLRDVVKGK
jgi:DNA-binding protein HU-beta